jgi:formamidopyrimidine-DNA glycosylase
VASFAAYHQTLPPVYSHYHQSQNGPTQFGHRPGYGVENAKACPELSVPQTPPPLPTLKQRLFTATQETLKLWVDRLQAKAKLQFPEKVTAFRKGMAVHGRYGEPCPKCGDKVLRIRYADKETNYCARCQTGGKVLADRSLSRLLGSDWPRTLEELEALKHR